MTDRELNKKEKSVVSMAKFIKSQSLMLLNKIEEQDLDDLAEDCEALNELAEKIEREATQTLMSREVITVI